MIHSDIVKGYHGLRKYQKKPFNLKYVKTKEYVDFHDFGDALRYFSHLISEFDPKDTVDQFIRSKLISTFYYLKHRMGETIPFTEYIQCTVGITPVTYNDEEIEALVQNIADQIRQMGISYDKESLKKLEEVNTIEINEDTISLYREKLVKKAQDYLNVELKKPVRRRQ